MTSPITRCAVWCAQVIARDVVRIVVCLCFCLVHTAVVIVFRMKFKRYGRPERPYPAETVRQSCGFTAVGMCCWSSC